MLASGLGIFGGYSSGVSAAKLIFEAIEVIEVIEVIEANSRNVLSRVPAQEHFVHIFTTFTELSDHQQFEKTL